MRLPKFNLPLTDEGRLVQTEITMRDFSPNRFIVPKHLCKMTSEFLSNDVIPLRKSQTRELLPKRNIYKEHLQNEILNWIQNVPMFYTLNFTTKDIKENLVNNLAEKINVLAVEALEKNYEIKTKVEIENCLNRLPMWLPGSKQEQIIFKDGLKEKLWHKIQELNENFLGIEYDKTVAYELQEDTTRSNESYEKEVVDWSLRLQLNNEKCVSRRQIVDIIMKRLTPLLKIPLHTTSYKLILKGEIIDILDDLPLTLTSPRYRTVHLNRFAEELANRLLSIQIKHEACSSKNTTVFHTCASQFMGIPIPKPINLRKIIHDRVSECLDKVQVSHRNDLKTEICSTFLDSKDHLRTGDEISIRNEICQFLRDTGKLPVEKTQNVAKMIIKQVIDALKNIKSSTTTSFDSVIPELSGTISVYRWGQTQPVTSTPKKEVKKEIPKLNTEEKSYMDKVAALIRTWLDTLPKQYNEDKKFKETIINDLAGDIMDELKVEQLAPETIIDKDKYLNYLMFRWLYRFQFFDDATIRNDARPYIADFLKRLKTIPVPILTASQHGTRQAMGNIQHMQGEHGWEEDYVAKGIDVLEDQISVWMNEQPSEIYNNKDKFKRNKMVHDLALTLQDRLRNKSPDTEIEKDINQWLKKIVKPKEKEHIGLLSQNLKEKVINIPQDQTLEARHEERKREMAQKQALKRQIAEQPQSQPVQDVSNLGNIVGDPDKTIRAFIAKYVEHNYDIDDPMAIGAFSHLLKTELRKLSTPTRKEVYENFDKLTAHPQFSPDKLQNELEYIKTISDWLKNIPIDASYNRTGNKDRIQFINDLAKNIQEIEEQRVRSPNELNYNFLIASVILQSMNTYGLPIPREQKDNTPFMVDQLLQKLVEFRRPNPCCKYANQPSTSGEQSLDISDIKEQNLSDFIADYIRINGRDIADDEIKLEAWTARLLKEVKKLLHDGADPSTLCKAQVYNKFSEVPIPTDESVRRFNLELTYVKDISEWVKNLPLLPIENQAQAEERIKMISELAERMAEVEAQKRVNPNDKTIDKKLEEYITTWISRLPLDPRKDIVMPIVTQQLITRMQRVHRLDDSISEAPPLEELQTSTELSNTASVDDKGKGSKDKGKKSSKSMNQEGSDESVDKKSIKDKCPLKKYDKMNPAAIIVEAIENWSNKLPIKGDDKEAIKTTKESIARKLYQTIGELNVDPKIFNDDLLYKDMLGDEIDTQLENVPQNPELQKNREKLKEGLLNTILETKKIIKEKSAGDNYKHKLETTIDASIPNPVQSTQAFDPGFEIYKNHLANMFILENFDHSNYDVKVKYEKRIRIAIDKFFESAQNKNALPLTKDQIYNELYSALFKVQMPNENSVIDEVEQVKTRCEIDTWFEDLPMQKAAGVGELLEWDKILSTLTKKIHEIEKSEPKPDKKIHKEITKWLEKLPLLPGNEGLDVYANKLQTGLKATAEDRKYVPPGPKDTSKGKSKKVKESKGKKETLNTSQVAGPSSAGQNWVSPPSSPQSKATTAKPCCPVSPMAYKKPGDIIVEVVEEWCNQLPLISSEENNRAIRDNISTRIIIQISELNMDPEIFNDDVVYDELLDEELENVMANLPVCCDFQNSKAARKYQLKEIIKSIKPLIKEEKARHEYKQELNSTVAIILKEPHNTTADKVALFTKLKDDIVDNFVQYNYNINDEEGKQIYKNNLHDAVVKYFMDIKDKTTDEQVDPLVKGNQLLCELGKIPIPKTALKEEVEEIKMRNEVEQFFQEQSIPEGDTENKLKKNLSKRLCDIEKSGHNCTNDKKMKTDITRCLKKLNKDVSPKVVDDFIEKLKKTELERKAPPLTISQAEGLNQSNLPGSPSPIGPGEIGSMVAPQSVSYPQQTEIQKKNSSSQSSQQQNPFAQIPQQPSGVEQVEQWISLLPATPPRHLIEDLSYHQPYKSGYRPEVQVWSPYASDAIDPSLNQTTVSYEDFEAGRGLLSSTAAPQGYGAPAQSLGQSYVDYEGFERKRPLSSSSAAHAYGPPIHQSHHSSHKSMNKNQAQQSHNFYREGSPTSGPIQAQPSYGQIATPRQVAQTPRQMAQTPRQVPQTPSQSITTPGDATPESLFQVPVFRPTPIHRPFPVPIIDPVPLPGSVGSMQPRRSLQGPDAAIVPTQHALAAASAPPGPKGFESSDEEEILCRCERCRRRSCRGIPYCMLSMEEYLDDCIGFGPMWCRMHFPECFYY